jgi:hypothetical protein
MIEQNASKDKRIAICMFIFLLLLLTIAFFPIAILFAFLGLMVYLDKTFQIPYVLNRIDETTECISKERKILEDEMLTRKVYLINKVIDYLDPCAIEGVHLYESFLDTPKTLEDIILDTVKITYNFVSNSQEDLITYLIQLFSMQPMYIPLYLQESKYMGYDDQYSFLKSMIWLKA